MIHRRHAWIIKSLFSGSEDILGKLEVGEMRYDLIESVVNSGLGGRGISNSGLGRISGSFLTKCP